MCPVHGALGDGIAFLNTFYSHGFLIFCEEFGGFGGVREEEEDNWGAEEGGCALCEIVSLY